MINVSIFVIQMSLLWTMCRGSGPLASIEVVMTQCGRGTRRVVLRDSHSEIATGVLLRTVLRIV